MHDHIINQEGPAPRGPAGAGRRRDGRWILSVVVMMAAGASAVGLFVTATAAAASTTVPYSDPNAAGYIGLCNQRGQQITSGSIDTAPFAWRAVSSVAAPSGYDGPTRTAILLAYQPIDGLAASDWSGDELTASTRYSNAASPSAAATAADWSLAQFMDEYKPLWDGFLQLRIYLGATNEQTYSVHYPTLDIQVTGDTWRAVDGGQVNCGSGTAESIESVVLTPSQLKGTSTSGKEGASASSTTTTTTTTASAGAGSATAGTGSDPSSEVGQAIPASKSAPADDHWPDLAVVVVAVALLSGLGLLVVRRRRAAPVTSGDSGPNSDAVSSQ